MNSKVFFIRGFAKSGTNWLCNLMNLHPQIKCMGEFHLAPLFEARESIQNARFGLLKQQNHLHVFDETFSTMIESLVTDVCGNAPLCGDRTPCTLRKTFLPHVQHLYIARDGRDIAVSWIYHAMNWDLCDTAEMKAKQRVFADDPQYFENNKHELLSCEETVRSVTRHWNETLVDDFAMMDASDRGENSLRYHRVRYEDLQVDTDHHRNAMYSFLGLAPSIAESLTPKTQPQFGQSNFNDPQHFYRRGQAGTWQEYFTDEQLGWFKEEAAEAMRLVGIHDHESASN